jgi:hypothetical protein
MQLNFTNVSWIYVIFSVAVWLALVVYLWHKPNEDHLQQWREFNRVNPGMRLEYKEWLNLPNGPGSPVAPGHITPIAQVSVAFWSILLLFVFSAANAA